MYKKRLPHAFERELTYMNFVYFKTQCDINIFKSNEHSIPMRKSEHVLF